jgi:deoxyribose-phosphate aldolase
MKYNKYIEYTNLKAKARSKEILQFVDIAGERNYRSVVVTYNNAGLAKRHIEKKKYDLKVVTVMGFPSDNYSSSILEDVYKDDYDELDFVIPVNDYYYNYPPYLNRIESYLKHLKSCLTSDILGIDGNKIGKPIKFIIETALMRAKDMQIKELCDLAKRCEINVIKTNTGLIKRANFKDLIDDVTIIQKYWNGDIKASGGIKSLADVEVLVKAGVTLIGTSTDVCDPTLQKQPLIIPRASVAEEEKNEKDKIAKDSSKSNK